MTKLNKRSIETCADLPKWGLHFLELVSNIKKGAITIITPDGKYLKFVNHLETRGPNESDMIGFFFFVILTIADSTFGFG